MNKQAVFDGHNDLLARLYMAGGVSAVPYYQSGRPRGHLDAAKAEEGGFAGGFFAVWVPSPEKASKTANSMKQMSDTVYDIALPPMLDQDYALRVVQIQIDILKALEAAGDLAICTDVGAIEHCMKTSKTAAILHMEGAEAIDHDLQVLNDLYALGLRSLGLVWSRPTLFAHGVPFRFPSSPDTGDGLTVLGRRLVARCNQLGVMVDLSHLTEAGFWDVAAHSSAPLVATHSNAHALCPHARNLTDKQLDAVRESHGVVGLNFATAFLRADGRMISDTPLDLMVDHLSHMIERMGEDCVALGSDFDGAVVPQEIGSVAGLPNLVACMAQRGYNADLINKICQQNWMRVLAQTWR